MEYRKETSFTVTEHTAITIGKFDGVHRGHQKLIGRLNVQQEHGLKALVFTFQTAPAALLGSRRAEVLLTNDERRARLESLGMDYLIEYPFTDAVSRIEPEDFVKEILVGRFGMKHLAVGPDFRFGYQQKGDISLLRELAGTYGYEVEVVEKEKYKDTDISSTYIKQAIYEGDMESAAAMLGYPYFVCAEVVHGRKMGRRFGFPTINQIPEAGKLMPPNGVYASLTEIHGMKYPGITNIGYKPSVGAEKEKGVETHIFDFDEDLYGTRLKVELFAFERPEQKFASTEELKSRIAEDMEFGRVYFKENKRSNK